MAEKKEQQPPKAQENGKKTASAPKEVRSIFESVHDGIDAATDGVVGAIEGSTDTVEAVFEAAAESTLLDTAAEILHEIRHNIPDRILDSFSTIWEALEELTDRAILHKPKEFHFPDRRKPKLKPIDTERIELIRKNNPDAIEAFQNLVIRRFQNTREQENIDAIKKLRKLAENDRIAFLLDSQIALEENQIFERRGDETGIKKINTARITEIQEKNPETMAKFHALVTDAIKNIQREDPIATLKKLRADANSVADETTLFLLDAQIAAAENEKQQTAMDEKNQILFEKFHADVRKAYQKNRDKHPVVLLKETVETQKKAIRKLAGQEKYAQTPQEKYKIQDEIEERKLYIDFLNKEMDEVKVRMAEIGDPSKIIPEIIVDLETKEEFAAALRAHKGYRLTFKEADIPGFVREFYEYKKLFPRTEKTKRIVIPEEIAAQTKETKNKSLKNEKAGPDPKEQLAKIEARLEELEKAEVALTKKQIDIRRAAENEIRKIDRYIQAATTERQQKILERQKQKLEASLAQDRTQLDKKHQSLLAYIARCEAAIFALAAKQKQETADIHYAKKEVKVGGITFDTSKKYLFTHPSVPDTTFPVLIRQDEAGDLFLLLPDGIEKIDSKTGNVTTIIEPGKTIPFWKQFADKLSIDSSYNIPPPIPKKKIEEPTTPDISSSSPDTPPAPENLPVESLDSDDITEKNLETNPRQESHEKGETEVTPEIQAALIAWLETNIKPNIYVTGTTKQIGIGKGTITSYKTHIRDISDMSAANYVRQQMKETPLADIFGLENIDVVKKIPPQELETLGIKWFIAQERERINAMKNSKTETATPAMAAEPPIETHEQTHASAESTSEQREQIEQKNGEKLLLETLEHDLKPRITVERRENPQIGVSTYIFLFDGKRIDTSFTDAVITNIDPQLLENIEQQFLTDQISPESVKNEITQIIISWKNELINEFKKIDPDLTPRERNYLFSAFTQKVQPHLQILDTGDILFSPPGRTEPITLTEDALIDKVTTAILQNKTTAIGVQKEADIREEIAEMVKFLKDKRKQELKNEERRKPVETTPQTVEPAETIPPAPEQNENILRKVTAVLLPDQPEPYEIGAIFNHQKTPHGERQVTLIAINPFDGSWTYTYRDDNGNMHQEKEYLIDTDETEYMTDAETQTYLAKHEKLSPNSLTQFDTKYTIGETYDSLEIIDPQTNEPIPLRLSRIDADKRTLTFENLETGEKMIVNFNKIPLMDFEKVEENE